MRRLVYDIETTGFKAGYDAIVSFAFLEFNKECTEVLNSGICYFYKKGMRWSDEAEAVHGLSREFLSQYEDQYSDNLKTMYKKMTKANVIGYNNDFFDNRHISAFLDNEMYGTLQLNTSLDLMKVAQPVFKQKMKLQALTEKLGANTFILNALSNQWFGEPFGWHKAHGDVVATAFCYIEMKRRGYCD